MIFKRNKALNGNGGALNLVNIKDIIIMKSIFI
jgi:hypothetical protein